LSRRLRGGGRTGLAGGDRSRTSRSCLRRRSRNAACFVRRFDRRWRCGAWRGARRGVRRRRRHVGPGGAPRLAISHWRGGRRDRALLRLGRTLATLSWCRHVGRDFRDWLAHGPSDLRTGRCLPRGGCIFGRDSGWRRLPRLGRIICRNDLRAGSCRRLSDLAAKRRLGRDLRYLRTGHGPSRCLGHGGLGGSCRLGGRCSRRCGGFGRLPLDGRRVGPRFNPG
jgi:hypothetical protein